jgi:LDH2 family malate/lactate/ureidoglycolate dehydrogenase
MARIKATPTQPGVSEIRLPSENAHRQRARNLREGLVLEVKIYDGLTKLAGRGSVSAA